MKQLTLSFDNGPNPATRRCAERAAAEGHWIGNYTWTHSLPLEEQPGRAAAEITRTQDELGSLTHRSRWFHPMGGGAIGPHLLSQDAMHLLTQDAYSCVLWNAVSRDWAEPNSWVEMAGYGLRRLDR